MFPIVITIKIEYFVLKTGIVLGFYVKLKTVIDLTSKRICMEVKGKFKFRQVDMSYIFYLKA